MKIVIFIIIINKIWHNLVLYQNNKVKVNIEVTIKLQTNNKIKVFHKIINLKINKIKFYV
jgi:hypothetical protein